MDKRVRLQAVDINKERITTYECHGMQHGLEKNTYWRLIVL